VTEPKAETLYELADLIHAIARQLAVPADLRPGPCTALEISVMRFVVKNPGTSAGAAAQATRLPSSNFSRLIKGLVLKGLLRRETDDRDARAVRLYPTGMALSNRESMREAWSRSLDGTASDLATLDLVNSALRQIESELAARSQAPLREPER